MSRLLLQVDIRSYWHPGTGKGSTFSLDSVVNTGRNGLPRVPGRTLKGLVRDACERAEAWGWLADFSKPFTDTLFGERSGTPEAPLDRVPEAGALRFGDAALPEAVAQYLTNDEDRAKLIPELYREIHMSAIDRETGTARDRSLRGMEVVVPMQLQAPVDLVPGREGELEPGWQEGLGRVLPLVEAVGAHRSRGLGRAVLSLGEG
jgi:CRISPR/Cas system CSM-associated protein Csm3 (group 7 of RAMP superfamily)